jgi:hypothetical protein
VKVKIITGRGHVTPVYPVNRCGAYLRESGAGRPTRDNPVFSSQPSKQG